jgi:hypothetical protein
LKNPHCPPAKQNYSPTTLGYQEAKYWKTTKLKVLLSKERDPAILGMLFVNFIVVFCCFILLCRQLQSPLTVVGFAMGELSRTNVHLEN